MKKHTYIFTKSSTNTFTNTCANTFSKVGCRAAPRAAVRVAHREARCFHIRVYGKWCSGLCSQKVFHSGLRKKVRNKMTICIYIIRLDI